MPIYDFDVLSDFAFLANRGATRSAAPSTPTRHPNSQSSMTIQMAILEAERDASENAHLEAVEDNNRLTQENMRLRQAIEVLNCRIDGIPEIVRAAVETFLSAETE
jgi:hypothetical protein